MLRTAATLSLAFVLFGCLGDDPDHLSAGEPGLRPDKPALASKSGLVAPHVGNDDPGTEPSLRGTGLEVALGSWSQNAPDLSPAMAANGASVTTLIHSVEAAPGMLVDTVTAYGTEGAPICRLVNHYVERSGASIDIEVVSSTCGWQNANVVLEDVSIVQQGAVLVVGGATWQRRL